MTKLYVFTLNNYEERIESMYSYSYTIIRDVKDFVKEIRNSCSQVNDYFILNEKIFVPSTISNTAIYFACIELFGHAPLNIEEEKNKKICTLVQKED